MEINTPSKRVAIIILNYNGWQDTVECLESLQKVEYPDYLTIVVDNASTDGSVERIKSWAVEKEVRFIEYDKETAETGGMVASEEEIKEFKPLKKIVIIKNKNNLGYSGGNNVGARYAVCRGYEYIIILNNDTIIKDKDFLYKLVEPFSMDEQIFVVGPKIVTTSGDFDGPYIYESFWGELFCLTIRNQLHKLLDRPPVYIDIAAVLAHEPKQVYKVSGACMAIRASFLQAIQYLDENIWLSCEESAIAEQVLMQGGKIFYQPLTTVIHKKARSPRQKKRGIEILRNHFNQRAYFLRTYRKYGPMKMFLIRIVHKLRLAFEPLRN